MNLFETQAIHRIELQNGYIVLFSNWLGNQVSQSLMSKLMEELPWQSSTIKLFGKQVDIPRMECFFADSIDLSYGYSGKRLVTNLFTPELNQLKEKINAKFSVQMNSVLINLYRNENDSNGWHSDNETELGTHPIIVSYSLGASRAFHLKHKNTKERIRISLHHDELLFMSDEIQRNYLHHVPKQRKKCSFRINLTFRKIID
jgi:alkylated DNA repair dioxygenase AlkB